LENVDIFNFPEKTFPCGSFFRPLWGLSRPKKKKEKIGTIFCPKGGLAVAIILLIKKG
jgi:hypothetical protein